MEAASASSYNRSQCSGAQSLGRIMREYDEIVSSLNSNWTARPLNLDDPYEWHFVLRGPPHTAFEKGIYHGKILLPPNYPLAPPSFFFFNQNGRFEVGKAVCLSASKYHPDLWQPAWGIRTMLDALQTLFLSSEAGGIHSLDWSLEICRKLASQSGDWVCDLCKKSNRELLESSIITDTASTLASTSSVQCSDVCHVPSIQSSSVTVEGNPSSVHLSETAFTSTPKPHPVDNTKESIPDVSSGTENITNATVESSVRNSRDPPTWCSTTTPPSSRKLTFKLVFWMLVVSPILNFVAPPFQDKSMKKRIVYLLDVLTVLLIIITFMLSVDVVRRPASVFNAFSFHE